MGHLGEIQVSRSCRRSDPGRLPMEGKEWTPREPDSLIAYLDTTGAPKSIKRLAQNSKKSLKGNYCNYDILVVQVSCFLSEPVALWVLERGL